MNQAVRIAPEDMAVSFELTPGLSGLQLLQRWIDTGQHTGGFPELLQCRPVESREGYVRIDCDIHPGHANFMGLVHGGVMAALIDMAGGGAGMSTLKPGETLLTTDLTMRFLKSAPIDCRSLEVVGTVSHRSGRKAVTEAVVTTPAGVVVAQGTVGVSIRTPR